MGDNLLDYRNLTDDGGGIIFYKPFFLILFLSSVSDAALFGISPKLFNRQSEKLENSIKKMGADNKIGINDVKFQLGKIEANVSAQAQVQAKIMAGVDKSNTQSAGRDIVTETSNDPKMILGMVGIFAGALQTISVLAITILYRLLKHKCKKSQEYRDLWLSVIDPTSFEEKKRLERDRGIKNP